MGFELNLKENPTHEVEYNGLIVKIKPLSKREDIKLVEKHTKGQMKVLQGQKKKGFRRKEKDELIIPEIEYFELNLERAIKTWLSWNIKDQPCNAETITALFDRYYNELAEPIMEKLEEVIEDYNRGVAEEGKN